MGHGGLLLHCGGNLLVLVDDHADRSQDVFQRPLDLFRLPDRAIGHFMAGAHGLDRRADTAMELGDHLLDFFGRLLGSFGQGPDFVGYHGETTALLTGPCRLDGGIERQQVGLLGDALDHFEHTADGLAVAGQLVDHQYRLIDLAGQRGNAALLRLHQATTTDGLIVDTVGTAHRRGGTARHFLGSGRHLVHRRGHLFDLRALPGDGLVALRGNAFHLAGLTLDFADGLPHPLDQVMDLFHRAVEHFAQLPQLIAAVGAEGHGHVAGRHLVHHRPQALERGAGRGIESAVEIKDQHKDD
ncbi:hypothetical protein D9M71_382980 [compost metagenome]